MFRVHGLISSVAFLGAVLVAQPVQAGIVIQNSSFELPDIIGNFDFTTPTGWDWNGIGTRGVIKEGFVGHPANTDGDQWGFLLFGAGLSQEIGPGMLQPNSIYEFSFFQYEQNNISDNGSGVSIEIWEGNPLGGGSLLDSTAFAATGSGISLQRNAALNSGGSATAGGDLYLAFRAITDPNNPSGISNVSIDEIAMGASPVPEPSSLVLSVIGIVGLIGHRIRKRKHDIGACC